MSCFRELFARFPDKLMELCVEDAEAEGRLYCYIFDWPHTQDACALCDRPQFDDGGAWHKDKRLCTDDECRRLWAWIWAPGVEGGNKRRIALKETFGTRSIWQVPHPVRREAILAAMLLHESKEKLNARKPRFRVAA